MNIINYGHAYHLFLIRLILAADSAGWGSTHIGTKDEELWRDVMARDTCIVDILVWEQLALTLVCRALGLTLNLL